MYHTLTIRLKIANMKKAFVTGISKGIGKSICIQLIKEGYFVYGTYNTDADSAKKLEIKYKGKLITYQLDLNNRAQTLDLLDRLKVNKFDVVVNNAGTIIFEDFDNYDFSIWDKTLEVNLSSALIITMTLSKNMKKGGSIINVSSTDGMTGSFASMAYAASKSALINITKSLGNNLGTRGVRVNSIAPGWINTGMSTDESYEAVKLTPLGRNGKPEEIADIVSFLICDKSSFINGTTIVADGGYTNVDYIMKMEADDRL
jgi:NAD(P)-dependent dehydrogenase (short-subunit alcohol dehydrogenase family)